LKLQKIVDLDKDDEEKEAMINILGTSNKVKRNSMRVEEFAKISPPFETHVR